MNKKNNPTIKNIYAIVYILITISTIDAMDPYEVKVYNVLGEEDGKLALLFLLGTKKENSPKMPKEYKTLLKNYDMPTYATDDHKNIIFKCLEEGRSSEDEGQEPESMPED